MIGFKPKLVNVVTIVVMVVVLEIRDEVLDVRMLRLIRSSVGKVKVANDLEQS